jgi:hypothetical protein
MTIARDNDARMQTVQTLFRSLTVGSFRSSAHEVIFTA